MQWLDATLIEPVWQQIAPTAPTNPSSLTLALIGVGTLLFFSGRVRSRCRLAGNEASTPEVRSEERRAA